MGRDADRYARRHAELLGGLRNRKRAKRGTATPADSGVLRLPLAEAVAIAQEYQERMAPFCSRIEIAGSIRREKQTVKDIELVAVPKYRMDKPEQPDLFGEERVRVNLLDEAILGEPFAGEFEATSFGESAKGLLCLRHRRVKIDLFSVTGPMAQWGVIFMIRTGSGIDEATGEPGGFSRGMLIRWKEVTDGGYSKDGMLHTADTVPVPTPEEIDVFKACRVSFIPPKNRTDRQVVRGFVED